MSVPTGARGENLTTVFTLSLDLLALVMETTMNDRHFPHKYTRELGEPAVAVARDIMHSVYGAEKATSAGMRDQCAEKAFIAMNNLQAEIHLNYLDFRLSAPKAGEIIDKLTELRTKFTAWCKAVR